MTISPSEDRQQKARDQEIIKLLLFVPWTAVFLFLLIRDFRDGDVLSSGKLSNSIDNPIGFYFAMFLMSCMCLFGIVRIVLAIRCLAELAPTAERER